MSHCGLPKPLCQALLLLLWGGITQDVLCIATISDLLCICQALISHYFSARDTCLQNHSLMNNAFYQAQSSFSFKRNKRMVCMMNWKEKEGGGNNICMIWYIPSFCQKKNDSQCTVEDLNWLFLEYKSSTLGWVTWYIDVKVPRTCCPVFTFLWFFSVPSGMF
jgi:hypothetical protein